MRYPIWTWVWKIALTIAGLGMGAFIGLLIAIFSGLFQIDIRR